MHATIELPDRATEVNTPEMSQHVSQQRHMQSHSIEEPASSDTSVKLFCPTVTKETLLHVAQAQDSESIGSRQRNCSALTQARFTLDKSTRLPESILPIASQTLQLYTKL